MARETIVTCDLCGQRIREGENRRLEMAIEGSGISQATPVLSADFQSIVLKDSCIACRAFLYEKVQEAMNLRKKNTSPD